eukprot:GHVU01233019.1.p1 GENE.GHVU01233019.1~~GHVU01233019.1.p1  ORF type:complete len:106 (+),score=0.13 GHVU01233019.1:169-486(+)
MSVPCAYRYRRSMSVPCAYRYRRSVSVPCAYLDCAFAIVRRRPDPRSGSVCGFCGDLQSGGKSPGLMPLTGTVWNRSMIAKKPPREGCCVGAALAVSSGYISGCT